MDTRCTWNGAISSGQIGDGLLVSHGQHHRVPAAVIEAQQFRADGGVTARLFPQRGGLGEGKLHFLPGDRVHFLADHPLDFPQDTLAQGQHGVQTRGERLDIAAAQQKNVAGEFGARGGFAESLDDELRDANAREW